MITLFVIIASMFYYSDEENEEFFRDYYTDPKIQRWSVMMGWVAIIEFLILFIKCIIKSIRLIFKK